MKTARMIPIHIREYANGFAIGQGSVGSTPPVFPNATLAAWATDETGFHSANTSRGPGSEFVGTKAFETNVNGMMNMNDAFCTTSTLGTFKPM
jgi:hypothetical protein